VLGAAGGAFGVAAVRDRRAARCARESPRPVVRRQGSRSAASTAPRTAINLRDRGPQRTGSRQMTSGQRRGCGLRSRSVAARSPRPRWRGTACAGPLPSALVIGFRVGARSRRIPLNLVPAQGLSEDRRCGSGARSRPAIRVRKPRATPRRSSAGVAEGKLRPAIDAVLPFERAAEALERLEQAQGEGQARTRARRAPAVTCFSFAAHERTAPCDSESCARAAPLLSASSLVIVVRRLAGSAAPSSRRAGRRIT